jgi:hypothetical protein
LRLLCFNCQPTRQPRDLVASNRETVIHHQRIWQAGPVKRAIQTRDGSDLVS